MSKRHSVLSVVCAALTALATPAFAAGSGVDALSNFYERVNSFQARFVQQQTDEEGGVLQQSSGSFALSRPAQFRWEYTEPYDQIIVSNGEVFRFYDVDLSQVTVRDVDDSLRATPALLLSGGTALEEQFSIFASGTRDGLVWVKLVPHDQGGDFKEIRMGFEGDVPVRMQLHDNLGQVTQIRFEGIEINQPVPAHRFELTIPDGVEIVDGRAPSPGNGSGQ